MRVGVWERWLTQTTLNSGCTPPKETPQYGIGAASRMNSDPLRPRSLGRGPVEAILAIIPTAQRRDRLLFRLILCPGRGVV
jgi:hypothetical protein